MARGRNAHRTPNHKSKPAQIRLGSKAREELAAKLEILQCGIEGLKQQRETWGKTLWTWPVETIKGPDETPVVNVPQSDTPDEKHPRVIGNVYRASRSHSGKMCRLELQDGALTWRVVMDPMLDRMDEDCAKEIGRLEQETAGIKLLLNPPIGRPQERMYDRALVEQAENPSLTTRILAEKYLPHYFPAHAEAAIDAMRHGIASARKRQAMRNVSNPRKITGKK
jgi:hypothetical protein